MMKKKVAEYFEKYTDTLRQLEEKRHKLIVLKNRLYDVKGVSYEETPKGTGSSDIVFKIQEIDDLKRDINLLIGFKTELEEVHLEEISKLSNVDYKSIMRCYYLERMSVEDISTIIDKSISHTFKMKKYAETEFVKIIVNDSKW